MYTFCAIARDDLATLHAWIQRPHVAAWWAEPRTLSDIMRDSRRASARSARSPRPTARLC